MEDKIKNIIAAFIRVPAEQITYDTIIDRSSVNSSITLHRMYAKLAEEGIVVQDYWNIQKFAMLVERVNGNGHANLAVVPEAQTNSNLVQVYSEVAGTAIGIDMEEVDAMPKASDFREAEFYKMNFSSTEIAYCILQPDPYASFAGLFAAKEAIIKANNSNRNRPFNTIVINHSQEGKPEYSGYSISISHTNNVAVAVALQTGAGPADIKTNGQPALQQRAASGTARWLVLISFFIALAALVIALLK